MSIFLESNRWKHFVLGIPTGLLTILFTLGIACGLEFKDVQYNNPDVSIFKYDWSAWDWLDWMFTVLGGLIGQGILLLIIYLCL